MNRSIKRFFLVFYFIAVTAGFAYYLFPSKAVVDFVTVQAKRIFPEMTVVIQDAKPSFPPGISLRGITVRHGDVPGVEIDKVNISLTFKSLFTKQKGVRITAQLLGGKITGDIAPVIEKGENGPQMVSSPSKWTLTGIDLGRLQPVKQATGLDMTGALSGEISGEMNAAGPKIAGELTVSGYRAAFSKAMFGIEALEWKDIKAEFEWTGRQLNLKKCEAAGPQTDVTISGKGEWKMPVGQSTLAFEGTIKPQPEFMAQLTKTVPAALLPKKAAGKDWIPIKVKGTVGTPDLSFK